MPPPDETRAVALGSVSIVFPKGQVIVATGKFWRILELSAPVAVLCLKMSEQPGLSIAFIVHHLPLSQNHGQRDVRITFRELAAEQRAYQNHRKFYDLLDVSPDASDADLKKAYRKKCAHLHSVLTFVANFLSNRALRLHPDKGGDPELFKEVTHA